MILLDKGPGLRRIRWPLLAFLPLLLCSLLSVTGCASLPVPMEAELPPATAMPVVKIVTVVVTVVVTATPTPEPTGVAVTPTPSPRPTLTNTPVTLAAKPTPTETPEPTATAVEAEMKYPAPRLIFEDGTRRYGEGAFPILTWEPMAAGLGADEYYEVTIERNWQNRPFYAGSDWTKETEFYPQVFGTSDNNRYTWWVTVKLFTGFDSHGGNVGVPISPPSEQRTFEWYE
jgi:hypothetical protein